MTLVLLGILWHVFPVTAMILMAPHGRKWEGFYLCLLTGPIGLAIVLVWRSKLEEERDREGD